MRPRALPSWLLSRGSPASGRNPLRKERREGWHGSVKNGGAMRMGIPEAGLDAGPASSCQR